MLASALVLPTNQAQASTIGPQQVRVTAVQMLALTDEMLRRNNPAQAERILDLLSRDPSPQMRSEALFRLAKLLAKEGKKTEAAAMLRHVIDDNPQAAPPRLELASLLHQMGDASAALKQLHALGTLDLPLNVARFVDRMSASLKASRPFSFQLELALAPDTNINRATKSETLGTVLGDFTFDEESKAKSGVGAAARGFVQGRLSLSSNIDLKAHGSIDASVYRHREFNDISLELAAGPEFQIGAARIGVEAGGGQQWYGKHSYQRSLRLSSSAWLKVDSVSQLRLDGAARWSKNQVNRLQDGRGFSAAARYERALSPQLTISVGAGFDRFSAQEDAYSTRSWTATANLYQDIGRVTLDAGVDLGGLRADDRLTILPNARDDKLIRLHLGTVFRQLNVGGFSPTIRLVMERNRSSVEYYDYKRTRTEFGISRSF